MLIIVALLAELAKVKYKNNEKLIKIKKKIVKDLRFYIKMDKKIIKFGDTEIAKDKNFTNINALFL